MQCEIRGRTSAMQLWNFLIPQLTGSSSFNPVLDRFAHGTHLDTLRRLRRKHSSGECFFGTFIPRLVHKVCEVPGHSQASTCGPLLSSNPAEQTTFTAHPFAAEQEVYVHKETSSCAYFPQRRQHLTRQFWETAGHILRFKR